MYEKDINQVFQSVIATRSSYVKSFKFMFSVRRAKIPNFEVIIWTLDRETFTDSFNYLRLCLLAVFHTLQILASPELISIQGIPNRLTFMRIYNKILNKCAIFVCILFVNKHYLRSLNKHLHVIFSFNY